MSDQQIQCSDCGGAFAFTDSERAFYESKGLASPPKRCPPCRKARKLASPDRRPGGAGAGGAGGRPAWRGGNGGSQNGGGGGGARGGFGAPSEGRGWGKPSFRPNPNYQANHSPNHAGNHAGNYADRSPPPARGRGPRFGDSPPRFRDGQGADRPVSQARSVDSAPKASPKAPPAVRPTRPKFDITCASCQVQAQVPFKPLEGREVFCQPCYRARRGLPAVEIHTEVGGGVEAGDQASAPVGPEAGIHVADEGENTLD